MASSLEYTQALKVGELLMHIGTIYASQGDPRNSVKYLEAALARLRNSVGDKHYLTAITCYKLSTQFAKANDYYKTGKLLKQAAEGLSGTPYYAADLARVRFAWGELLKNTTSTGKVETALREARELRKTCVPNDEWELHQLKREDYDKLVPFWAAQLSGVKGRLRRVAKPNMPPLPDLLIVFSAGASF
ncbi:hypothetical protein B0O99DRAFT_682481 [Bisporella sp. PMI_857]|nr:hypothetical protein B0O99DRAFT_682481 [Bisporella sp. PMI_857]